MVKMNFTENQTAFEYAMYMMFGSYFDKAVHKNKILEKKMRVQYMEQKETLLSTIKCARKRRYIYLVIVSFHV